jgi:hypothetical protein
MDSFAHNFDKHTKSALNAKNETQKVSQSAITADNVDAE